MCKIKVISDNVTNLKKYGKSDRYDNLRQKKPLTIFFVITVLYLATNIKLSFQFFFNVCDNLRKKLEQSFL